MIAFISSTDHHCTVSEVVTLEVPLLQVQVFVVSTTLTLGYPFLYQVGAKCIWEISTLGVCWLYVKWSVGTAYYCLLVRVWALCWKWKNCHLKIYVLLVVSPGNSSVDEGTPKACRYWNCFSNFPLHVDIMVGTQHSYFQVFLGMHFSLFTKVKTVKNSVISLIGLHIALVHEILPT